MAIRPTRRASITLALAGLATLAFVLQGRTATTAATLLLVMVVARVSGGQGVRPSQIAIRLLVGLGPAILLVTAAQDLAGTVLPTPAIAAVLVGTWILAARTLGAAAAQTVEGARAQRDVALRVSAVAIVTAFVAGAMIRLLLPAATSVERLAWILGEEDNAHVVGVAREVLTNGPRGAELADQYGTAFVNVPLLLARFVGGLPATELDPRLQAVSAFTASTLVVILMAGLAMSLLAALPHHVHARGPASPIRLSTSVISTVGTSVAAVIGMSLLVVLPMRTGFLTFVWGLTLVLLATASTALLPANATPTQRVVLVMVLGATALLLLSSWPFILPALVGLGLVPLTWIRWRQILSSIRQHPAGAALGAALTITLVAILLLVFSRWGPAAEVLSYGTDILLASASGIAADDLMQRAAWVAIATGVGLTVAARWRTASLGLTLSIAGPVLGGLTLYGALRAAAAVLTSGELNYSGIKLLYGIVVLAAILGLFATISLVAHHGLVPTAGATALAGLLLVVSPTASLVTDWWSRTDLGTPPHAIATVAMIDQTTPNLAIRCLPAPGTPVTGASRWAAYWCARWMEDAFNEGRFHGHRFDLLEVDADTFGPLVDEILAESESEYLFASRMTLGPGWFGWDGRS